MSLPLDVRAAAIAAIKETLPGLRRVEAHPGRFDLDEIGRFVTEAPSVRVALLGVAGIEREASGYVDVTLEFCAFVITHGSQRNPDGGEAADIAVAGLIPLIDRNDWELDGVDLARVKRAENLYGGALDGRGATIWAVVWEQKIRLGTSDAALTGTDETGSGQTLSTIRVARSPNIGSGHTDDYDDLGED